MNEREPRYCVLWVDQHAIGTIISEWRKCGHVYLPDYDLPADAELADVTYDWQRRSFGLRYWSASFDVVPDGQQSPEFTSPGIGHMMQHAISLETVPGLAVEKLSPKAGDMITLRCPVERQQETTDAARMLADKFDGVQFLVMPDDSTATLTTNHGDCLAEIEKQETKAKAYGRMAADANATLGGIERNERLRDAAKRVMAENADLRAQLAAPVKLWHYRAGNEVEKNAVLKAAREQTDRLNVAMPYHPEITMIDRNAPMVCEVTPGYTFLVGDAIPGADNDYKWVVLRAWMEGGKSMAEVQKKVADPEDEDEEEDGTHTPKAALPPEAQEFMRAFEDAWVADGNEVVVSMLPDSPHETLGKPKVTCTCPNWMLGTDLPHVAGCPSAVIPGDNHA